jgi:Peptidase family M28
MVFWRMNRRLVLFLFIALVAGVAVAWWSMIRMPEKNFLGAPLPLTPEQITLRTELVSDVQALAGNIGERNFQRYQELVAASDLIERSFSAAGLRSRRDTYEMRGQNFDNIETEIHGTQPEIVLIGAHYDSVVGSSGANDNGSGVAALLALARRFAGKPCLRTLRFVAFVNEEPFMFQSPEMGSYVCASRCRDRGDQITAMLSLETIGYYSNAPHSQTYPFPGLNLLYPTTGNFIGFVGNVPSRSLVREAIGEFRRHAQVPSQGAALPSGIPGIGWSDQWAFWQHGYPGIMITDTAPFRYPHYHAASDTPDKLDYDTMARVVQGLEKVIDHLVRSNSR